MSFIEQCKKFPKHARVEIIKGFMQDLDVSLDDIKTSSLVLEEPSEPKEVQGMILGARIMNPGNYEPGLVNRQVELKVGVMLDAVPGAWHSPADIMTWIAKHNYVQFVELVKEY